MSYSKSHFVPSHAASRQILARRAIVVPSKQTRSGVAVLGYGSEDGVNTSRAGTGKPRSMMLALISAAAAAWSVLTLFGHF